MRILLIEDDKELSENLKGSLIHAGYETDCCYNGIDALYYAKLPAYDLIILDRMLPGLDGLSILRSLRENQIHTPVILATAIDAVSERIAGLDCGADDYIVKPYDTGELLARIRALIRRPVELENRTTLAFCDLSYHVSSRELSCMEQSQSLSLREALLMESFLQYPDKVLSRQALYLRIWGPDKEVEDGNLDTYIYYIRKVLKKLNSQTQITTVHGVGYKLEEKQ